jgi:hypothetical protein
MIDKNINENNNLVKKAKNKIGVLKAGSLFLTGLGLCFLFAYPGMSYHMQSHEEKFVNELNSLKKFLKDQEEKKDIIGSSTKDINVKKNI